VDGGGRAASRDRPALREGGDPMTLPRVDVVIPALDEAGSLPGLVAALRAVRVEGFALRDVVVADNGSSDGTGAVARAAGARVVLEERRGYGAACLAALAALRTEPPDIVAFMDADGSDDPAQLAAVVAPLLAGADLAIGSRTLGETEPGALTPVQMFGNALAAVLMRVLFGARFTDLGPFRAIRWPALERLGMRDRDYGRTVEMQTRALRARLACTEVPVRCRRRVAGRSKIAGTLRGTFGAGFKILYTIGRVRFGG
jgi:glycosyltransferase involved in cell wall biosynthesis